MNEKYNIEAIETKYNGYHFRSRLEARWAVFFDAIGLEYVYEYKDFVLPNKGRYLPDFYFPTFDCYAEVKPFFDTDYVDLCVEFVKRTQKQILLLDGVPNEKGYRNFSFWKDFEIENHNHYRNFQQRSFVDLRGYCDITLKEQSKSLVMSIYFFLDSLDDVEDGFPFVTPQLIDNNNLLYEEFIETNEDFKELEEIRNDSNICNAIEKSLIYKFKENE